LDLPDVFDAVLRVNQYEASVMPERRATVCARLFIQTKRALVPGLGPGTRVDQKFVPGATRIVVVCAS
jgi:hypothetical protein